jgi:hypothetical protein
MTIEIFKPNENPFGISYEDHIKNFWKWTVSLPKNDNPRIDNNGQKDEIANHNSNSQVFYLSSDSGESLVERRSKVPRGRGVFIPVISVEVSEKEVENQSVDNLKRYAKKDQDSVKDLSLKLDGVEVNDIRSYRNSTNVFELEFPQDAIFEVSPGTSKAVADGFYVITKELTPGTHTIEFKGHLETDDDDSIERKYSLNVRYILDVQ